MRSKERTDIYTRVTNEIVAAIEAGAGSWTMPWHHDGSATSRPINACTRLSRKMGDVTAFTTRNEAMAGEELATCNAKG